MKILIASAFSAAMLVSVGASACEWSQEVLAYTPIPAAPTADAKVKQMVLTYLEELSVEKKLA